VRPPTAAESMDSDLSSGDESEDDINPADVEEGTEALAMQFYRIELAEQRRLMGVMEHHSKESGLSFPQPSTGANGSKPLKFPFSITAGVEKGAKNRWALRLLIDYNILIVGADTATFGHSNMPEYGCINAVNLVERHRRKTIM
jgi:hypothetical protein